MNAWPNLSDLLRAPDAAAPVGLIGAPLGVGSVTPGGCDQAPDALRAILPRIGRYDLGTGRMLDTAVADRGNLSLAGQSIEDATGPIRAALENCVQAHAMTLLVGGNNAITRPGVLALGQDLSTIGLVTLDAHFDMRPTASGLSNGNPVRALLEDGLPGGNIAQIGLAPFANSEAMHRDAMDGGHAVVPIDAVRRDGIDAAIGQALDHLAACDAIYVDCDIDVIDRSQFPGAPGARPGGMAVADFFRAVRLLAADRRVRIVDLTEWDPPLDPSDLSALTAGRWLAECLTGFQLRSD